MVVERKISPPLSAFNSLRQPLTKGELLLIHELDKVLPPIWEIYVQPHLNGLCPDLVLLNPFVGVVVFEVKDWDFNAMDYDWIATNNGSAKTLFGSKGGKSFRLENPLEKSKLYSSDKHSYWDRHANT
jgi:hypothetical protein